MVRSFFNHGYILKELNMIHITLVQKNNNPLSINHYKPFSLCNISYKIISKILINRLKKVFPKIISRLQGTFIRGQDIHDNIRTKF